MNYIIILICGIAFILWCIYEMFNNKDIKRERLERLIDECRNKGYTDKEKILTKQLEELNE